MERLLILGMGNSIVSDDRIGLHIVEKLRSLIKNPQVELRTIESSGLTILDVMEGFDSAIVIDAIKTGKHEPGEIIHFTPQEFDFTPRGTMVHDVSFFDALELGRKMDIRVPDRIEIFAIEIIDNRTVSEEISAPVLAACDPVICRVKTIMDEMGFAVG